MVSTAAAQVRAGGPLQIMYGIGGEHDLAERQLGHLAGWRGRRPVRAGNAAWQQVQLHVYGELLDAAWRLRPELGEPGELTRQFLIDLADGAAARWREPDHGIWEVRGEPRHFLYSKLMCWVVLDRAIALAGWLGATSRTGDWQQTREEIRDAIQRHGWSEQAGAFTQAFGSDQLDASSLMIPITGFLPASDPRVRATIDAIQHAPYSRPAAEYANDVGLLAEEIDPATGEQLGNFPQAFSHIGLINAAWTIAQAEAATRHPPGGRRR